MIGLQEESSRPGMVGYLKYVQRLEGLALTGFKDPDFAISILNAGPRQLIENVPAIERKASGAFFTGSKLAELLIEQVMSTEGYFDAAMGAGDLLLMAAKRLPLSTTLSKTLALWGERLAGYDIHDEFVRAAKARLIILARIRGKFHGAAGGRVLEDSFPLIKVSDAMKVTGQVDQKAIILNPPFIPVPSPDGCKWAKGKVNLAALFVERYLDMLSDGGQMLAILPEVLRSGTNYARWRELIESKCSALETISWGLFDGIADVDVFVLNITKSVRAEATKAWGTPSRVAVKPLESIFAVSVGAVVPHRHEEKGTSRRFLDARSAPNYGTLRRITQRRRFSGTVCQPPFVTIKRTSRPGDKNRAVPTLVMGGAPVAVENHLIVCKPHDGLLETCTKLVERLRCPSVTEWLDLVLRCRHLTVGAVRSIDIG